MYKIIVCSYSIKAFRTPLCYNCIFIKNRFIARIRLAIQILISISYGNFISQTLGLSYIVFPLCFVAKNPN